MDVYADIIVSGVVQGVGYRMFAARTAGRLGLKGQVKNLPSGQVEIEVEGGRGMIESLITELYTGNPWASVKTINTEWGRYTGRFHTFQIVT